MMPLNPIATATKADAALSMNKRFPTVIRTVKSSGPLGRLRSRTESAETPDRTIDQTQDCRFARAVSRTIQTACAYPDTGRCYPIFWPAILGHS
ncbi:MAG: hypothetical protein ACK58T_33710, partial [Phycisphaerae bacterium]